MTDQIAEVVDRYGKLRWVKCHIIEAKKEKYFCLHNKSLIPCPIQILHAFCLFVCFCLIFFFDEPEADKCYYSRVIFSLAVFYPDLDPVYSFLVTCACM